MGSTWDLVGGDPAPGDPGSIRQYATRLRQIAEDADGCREQLDGIYGQWASSDWTGSAAEEFRTRLGTVVPDLEKAGASYGTASSALSGFATTLSDLQAAAQEALGQAQSAQSRLAAADDAAAAARQAVGSATAEQQSLAGEIAGLTDAMHLRQSQLGPAAAATDPTIHSWTLQIHQLDADRLEAESRLRQANEDVASAEADARTAQGSLNTARRGIGDIHDQFESAVREVTGRLDEASAQGIRNVSFLDRASHDATSAVDHVSSEALADVGRLGRDEVLLATGHRSGLTDLADWAKHDVVAAAPVIHAITHAVARVTDDFAEIVQDLGPILPIAGLVIGFALGGPGGAELGDEIGTWLPTAAEGVATAADEAEVGSDELMQADGEGGDVDLSQDDDNLLTNASTATGDAVGALTEIPGSSEVVTEVLETGSVNPYQVVKSVGIDAVSTTAGETTESLLEVASS